MVQVSSTQRPKQFPPSRQRLLFALLAFSSLTSGGAAFAGGTPLPTGGQFIAGAGAIASTANGLAISQSSTHGIINWQSFSIAAGQSVNIANGTGATLNRVTGGDLSSIAGSLTATGSVYVVNTAGVVVLPGGKVTTGGSFVASSRDVSNSAFMAGGAMTLSGTSSGTVVNQGTITSANGDVILVGKSVTNSGTINAAKGTAALAAGDNVLLQASGDDAVLVNAGSGDVTNSGTINAAQAQLNAVGGNVYALATNDGGVIRATGTTTKDGHIYLTGGDGVSIDGAVSATNADGSGGKIVATAAAVTIGATAKISANGTTDGGTVLIGGDRHGGSDASVALSKTPIANAKTATVAAGATISADAGTKGKGGNVVVWSDQSTSYSGAISAKGGATGGDGGFVEVSGKQHLSFAGTVDTSASKGVDGTLLLDPTDVTITTGATANDTADGASPTNTFNPTGTASTINNGEIQNALANNNVVITTSSAGGGVGDININAPISWTSDHSLSLLADHVINFSSTLNKITTTGAGSITLSAAGTGIPTNGTAINVVANITANGGTITLVAPNPHLQISFSQGEVITNTTTHGAGLVVLKADEVRLGTGFAPSATVVTSGEVDVVPFSAGSILLGDNDPTGDFSTANNTVLLTQGDVHNITANLLVIGSTTTTDLTVTTPNNEQNLPFFDAAFAQNLKLLTGTSGTVTQDANTPIIVADTGAIANNDFNQASAIGTGGLAVQTGGAINLNYPNNSVGTIAFKQTGTGGDIAFARQGGEGGLVVGTVGDIGGITTVGTRTVTLTATDTTASPLSGSMGSLTVTQSAGAANAIKTTNLDLEGTLSSFTLDNASNAVTKIFSTGLKALNFKDSIGLVQNAAVTGSGGGDILINDAASITLNAGGTVTNANGDVTLVDGTTFTDNLGAGAITASGTGAATGKTARWLIYSQDPRNDKQNGLVHDFTQYNIAYPTAPVASQDGKNGVLYTIAPVLTESLQTPITKVYDGTTAATITAANYSAISGTVGSSSTYAGDSTALSNPTGAGVGSYDTKHVAGSPTKTITVSGLTLTATDAQGKPVFGYQFPTSISDSINSITAAAITISAATQTRQYDGTTTSSGSPTLTAGTLGTGDTLTATTQAYGSRNVLGTNGSTLTITGYTLTNAADYTVTTLTAMGTITPAPVTVTAVANTKTYDGTNSAAGTPAVTGTIFTPDTGSFTESYGTVHAGTGLTLTPTGSISDGNSGNNYTITYVPVMTGVINQTALTVTATTQSKTYGTTTGTLVLGSGIATNFTSSGLVHSETIGSVTLTGSGAATSASTNAGTVTNGITPSAATGGTFTAADYAITYVAGNVIINPALLTVTGTKMFDGTTAFSTGQLTVAGGATNGETVTLTAGTGTSTSPNVNTYPGSTLSGLMVNVTGGNGLASNYTVPVTGTLMITPATVTIVMVTGMRVYDGTTNAPGALLTVTNKVSPTDNVFLTGTGLGALAAKNVGTENITSFSTYSLAGTDASNYTLMGASGTVTITPLVVNLTGTRVYDGMTDASSAILSASNKVMGDSLTVASGSGTLGTKNVGTDTITSFGTLTLGGTDVGNYTLTGATGSVVVTPAPLTISAVTQTKVYDHTTTSTGTPTVVGLQTGDTVSGSPLTQAFGSANVMGTNGSTLSVTNYTGVNDGNSGNNYTVTVNTAMGTITPLAVTLTGTRVYDGMTDASSAILAFGNDLDGGNLTVSGTGVLASKNVNPTDALTSTSGALTGLTLGGSAAGNYTLTGASGSVNVTKAPLTISAVTQTKVYDHTTTSTGTPTIVGLQTGDTVSGSPLTQAFGSANVMGTNGSTLSVTNYTGVNDGNAGGNYTVTVNTAMGTITPLAVTLSGTRVYDGMTDASSTILSFGNDLDGGNLTVSGTGVLASKNVNPTDALTSTSGALTGLTLGGSAAGNYTLTGATGSVNVTPAPLTISAVTQTKVYDHNTTSTGTPTIVGLQTGDTVSGSPLTQAFGSANVMGTNGSTLSVTNYTGVNDGNSGNNYTVTVNTAMGTITPLAVTLTGTRVYDGMTDASSAILAFGNDLDGGNLTVSGTGVLASKNVNPTDALTSTSGALTGLTLGGSAAGNYTLTGASGSVNVTPAPLTISAVTQTKVYDHTTTSTGTPTIVGLQTGDTVSGSPLTQAFGSANVMGTNGSTLSVTNYTGVNDGNAGGNYTVTVNTAMGTITPLAVTLSGTRVYDGMTDASSTILSFGNDLDGGNLTVSGTGVLASKNVNPTDALTSTSGALTGLTLGGSAAGNYTLTGATGSVNVTPAPLTISAVTQTKVYDHNTTSTGTPTIVGLQTGDTVSGSPLTQAFGSANVMGTNGSTLSVTNYTGVNDGNSGNNYTVTVNTAMGTITPLAVTLTGTRVYDGDTDAAGSILGVSNDLDGVNLTVGGTGILASKNVNLTDALTSTGGALAGLTLGGSAAGNYTLTGASGSVNVTKATLTIAAVTQTKVYDGTVTSTGTPTVTGLQMGDTISTTPLTQAYASRNVLGTNGSTLSVTNYTAVNDGNAGGNYNVTVNTAMGTITPEAVTVTAVANTKTYDGTTGAAGTPIVTSGTIFTPDTGAFTESYGTVHSGTGLTLTPTGAITDNNGGNNYTVTYVPVMTGVINKAPLGISAVTQTRVYDGLRDSNGTPVISSGALVSGDTLTGLAQTYNSKDVLGTNGSTLTVSPGFTLTNASDYSVTLNTAMGTITPAPLTVTAVTNTKTYDGTPGAAGTPIVTSGTIFTGDTGSFTESYNTPHVGTGLTLTPTGTLTDGNGGNDYTVTYVPVMTGVINAAALSISAVTQTRVYDGLTDSSGAPIVTGLQGSDTVTNLSQAYGSKNVLGTNGSTLSVNAGYVVANASDYNITVNTAMGTITPAPLMIQAVTTFKTYDGTTTSNNSPLVTGTIYTGDTGMFIQTYANKNAGNFKTVTPSGSVADGNAGNNYTYTFTPGNVGTIQAAALTISAVTQTKVYDGTVTSTGTPTVVGLKSGDTISTTPLAQAYASRNVLGTNGSTLMVTNFTGVNDGNGGGNYVVTVNTAMGTITPEALTVTAVPTTKTYDGTPTSPGTPTVTTGTIFGPDKGAFTETYNTPHAGTGLTLTPTGTLTDGNGGGNYTVTYVPVTTGVINQAALSISAVTQTRVYDGLRDSNGTPVISSGALATGDTLTGLAQTYNSKNVLGTNGSTLTVTPGFTLSNASDYNVTLVTAKGTITPEPVTVTAVPTTKTYDGTPTSPGTPTITTGMIFGPDVGTFIETYNTPNAGTALKLTPSGSITDGNGGGNYIVTFTPVSTGGINPKAVILTGTRPFDNTPLSASPILTITNLIPGDMVTLGGTGTLVSPNVGSEPISNFAGLTLGGAVAGNYTFVGATGTVIVTPAAMQNVAESTTVPASQTASGAGETVTFSAFAGGILTLTPKQNGIVTGTIATIDGTDYHPDTQLGCTLGGAGCVENGVAAAPPPATR